MKFEVIKITPISPRFAFDFEITQNKKSNKNFPCRFNTGNDPKSHATNTLNEPYLF